MYDAYVFIIAMAIGVLVIAFMFYRINKTRDKYKKATTALGDTTHTTGVPNFPWKKLNISYLEYQMVVQALAHSGDFSPENVKHCLSGVDNKKIGRFV